MLGSSRMIVALEGSRFGFISAQASKVVVGHVAVEGKPLFELRKVYVRWYPLSLLTGKLAIFCRAIAYDGIVECSIDGIPVLCNGNPLYENKIREREPGKISGRNASMVQRDERKHVGLDQERSAPGEIETRQKGRSGSL